MQWELFITSADPATKNVHASIGEGDTIHLSVFVPDRDNKNSGEMRFYSLALDEDGVPFTTRRTVLDVPRDII